MARQRTLPCSFTGVSIGKDSARISVSVPAEKLPWEDARALFVAARISVKLSCDTKNGDAEGQQTMEGCDRDLDIEAESQGFHTYSDRYTASLKVCKSDTDIAALGEFANRRGKIRIKRVGDADAGEEGGEDGNGD